VGEEASTEADGDFHGSGFVLVVFVFMWLGGDGERF
jgi:hypothetical protein